MNATITLTDDEQYFYDNAGYSFDPAIETEDHGHAVTAIDLATAERVAKKAGAYIQWQRDWESERDINEGITLDSKDYIMSWTAVLYAPVHKTNDVDWEPGASLGGIDNGTKEDMSRVIYAQLAIEAANTGML